MFLYRQGGKTGAVQKCTTCRGRGMRIMIRQLAPGMVQQMQSVCTDCNGEGKVTCPVKKSSSSLNYSGLVCTDSSPQTLWPILGEVISEKDRCKKCEGKKVVKEVKILEVHVDKGMKHGQKITFGGEADQAPGVEPGDIVLVLQEKDNEVGGLVLQCCIHSWCWRVLCYPCYLCVTLGGRVFILFLRYSSFFFSIVFCQFHWAKLKRSH